MAKKQRRKQLQKGPRQPARAVAAPAPAVGQPVGAPQPRVPEPARRQQKAVVTWAEHAERYGYVNQELKSIGILAGSFLIVLLILSAVFAQGS